MTTRATAPTRPLPADPRIIPSVPASAGSTSWWKLPRRKVWRRPAAEARGAYVPLGEPVVPDEGEGSLRRSAQKGEVDDPLDARNHEDSHADQGAPHSLGSDIADAAVAVPLGEGERVGHLPGRRNRRSPYTVYMFGCKLSTNGAKIWLDLCRLDYCGCLSVSVTWKNEY